MFREYARRDFLQAAATLAGAALLPSTGSAFGWQGRAGAGWGQMPIILGRIKPPIFPARDFDITRYGAVGDAARDSTAAFKQAIEECSRAGGGRVVVPAGIFLTGAIHLKNNVNLHVTKDATLRFSQDPRAYLPAVFTRSRRRRADELLALHLCL